MKIRYYNYNAFILENGEKKIAIDPGATFLHWFRLKTLIPKSEWLDITHIFITHGDPDHYWYFDRIAGISGAAVFCNSVMTAGNNGNTRMLAPRKGGLKFDCNVDRIQQVQTGETVDFENIRVTGLRAVHGPLTIKIGPFIKVEDPRENPRVGWGSMGYQIEYRNKTIVNLGDSFYLQREWSEISEPDVLMIPIGGKHAGNTMDELDALKAVEQIRPRQVIPCHYACPAFFNKAAYPADTDMFKRECEALGAECSIMNYGDEIRI